MRVRNSLPYTFILPALAFLMVMAVIPTIYAVNISLQDRSLFSNVSSYIAFENYVDLLSDRRFKNAAWVSFKWELVTVGMTLLVAMGVGILMYETTGRRTRLLLSFIFLVPVLLPRVCAAFVWKFSFHPLYGIATYPYRLITGEPFDVFANSTTAFLAVAFVDVWQWGFFFAVIVLKLLETLPPQPLEAARLDHAGPWAKHALITLPMLKGPLIGIALIKAVESLRSFDLIYVMTRGGPGISTETLDMYAFSQGFIEAGNIGYASSMAVIMLIITIVTFTFVWKRISK